jgi:hypothetical protein
MTREWLRIVRYFKWQVRARNREPKRYETRTEVSDSSPQKHAKEL